jgi:hypothetical protein
MKKILWLSRHKPLPAQIAELERIFGHVTVTMDPKPFSSAEEIMARFRAEGYDEMVVVAPLSVIVRLTEMGIRPLWAEMKQIPSPSPDLSREVEVNGRWYRFERFRRIEKVQIIFSEFLLPWGDIMRGLNQWVIKD